MNETDPLSRLNRLDAELDAGLERSPTLLDTLAQRYRDAVPGAYADLRLDQLYLADAPLADHLCRLALGQPLVEEPILHRTADGLAPLPEPENQWARRFLLRAGPDMRQLHLDNLKRFWAFTRIDGQPAGAWLKDWYRQQLDAQTELRLSDRTLSPALATLVKELLAAEPSDMWQAIPILHDGPLQWPLLGSFVLSRKDPHQHPHEAVLLSSLAHGLEAFGSLAALYQELAERLEDQRQGSALLYALPAAQRAASLRADALTFEPVAGDLFAYLQERLQRRQQAEASQAWTKAEHRLAEHDLSGASDVLARAADLRSLMSSEGLRLTRYVVLLERDMPTWMKRLSQAQLLELVLAMHELGKATARAVAPGLPSIQSFADPSWLRQYARGQLSRQLAALNIEVPPERILVTVTTAEPSGGLVNPLSPSGSVLARVPDASGATIVPRTRRRDLVHLALDNISPLDFDYLLTAQVRDDRGQAIPGLTPAKVRELIRRANVGGGYGRHLLARLRYGPEAHWRREQHARLLQAKLRVEALKAYHRGQLGPDGEGLAWVQSLLNHPAPAGRRPVKGQPISAWQLFIRGTPLDGVYLVGPRDDNSPQPVLLYAAGSPSRESWQWFANRQRLTAQWLQAAGMKRYILAHVALAERDAIERLLGQPGLASHIVAREIETDFLRNAYRSETRRIMANADALSASNREVDARALAELAVTLTEVMCLFLPGRVATAFALTRSIWSFTQAYLTVGEEGASTVLMHAFEGFANLFEASAGLVTSPLFGKLVRKVPIGTPVPLHTHYAVRQQRTFLRYRLATNYSEQVYEAQRTEGGASEFYIQDRDGNRYQVLHDGEQWRVVDWRMPGALYKPIVRRNTEGHWEMVEEIRWRGLVPDLPALLSRIALAAPPDIPPGQAVEVDGRRYLRIGEQVMAIRPSLLPGRYTVVLPDPEGAEPSFTVLLRQLADGAWEAKVRDHQLSREWFELSSAKL